MKSVTSWFVLAAPLVVLVLDGLVYYFDGYESTITAVVRGWAKESSLPEFVFIVGCVLLWSHLFRNFP